MAFPVDLWNTKVNNMIGHLGSLDQLFWNITLELQINLSISFEFQTLVENSSHIKLKLGVFVISKGQLKKTFDLEDLTCLNSKHQNGWHPMSVRRQVSYFLRQSAMYAVREVSFPYFFFFRCLSVLKINEVIKKGLELKAILYSSYFIRIRHSIAHIAGVVAAPHFSINFEVQLQWRTVLHEIQDCTVARSKC